MYTLSLGDLQSQIKLSSTNQIGIPNLDNDFHRYLIPSQRSSRRSQFWLNFDLFLIKVNFELFSIKRSKKTTLKLIKRLKKSIKRLKKSIKRLKKLIYIKKVKFNWESRSFRFLSIKFQRLNLYPIESILLQWFKIWLLIWMQKVD